jgi:D-sedoheptulose 7-phosphate isomerase
VNTFTNYVITLQRTLSRLPVELLEEMVDCLHRARLARRTVFILGNGGSATTATHFACDLGKNTVAPHAPRFRTMALTDNMAVFSALANDLGYEHVFAEQLANFVQAGDIVIAISASGDSANVLKAVNLARQHQAFTIGWSGYDGGKLAHLVDLPIVIANSCIEQIEDIHLMLAHMATVAVRQLAETQPATPEADPGAVDMPLIHEFVSHLENGLPA